MPKRKWEHDGETDLPSRPRRSNGDWDWTKIKHRHYFVFDGPFVTKGPDRGYPIGVGGMHCNRDCGERREGPVCSAWGLDSGRCHRPGKVVDEKFPWGSATDSRSPPSVEHEGVTGWWYCGVHDPERKRARDRAWNIKFNRGSALSDQRYDEDRAASLLAREAVDWEKLESAVEPICETECEHHTCHLVRVARAYVALVASGDRLREEE